jgi:hypothetical protein
MSALLKQAQDAVDDLVRSRSRPVADEPQLADPPLFRVLDLAEVLGAEPKAQVWYWGHYVPAGHMTYLPSHGGVGKTVIALMVAVCIAAGMPCLSYPTKRARVLFFSAEDPKDMVLPRLRRICQSFDVDPKVLQDEGWLNVIDATDIDPVLYMETRIGGVRTGATTPAFAALEAFVAEHQVEVLFVDNASDTFDGDEINRAMVRAFVRSLVRLVRERNGAVILLAHVDKLTSRAGKNATNTEAYSGSTAWHNSARSRLFLLEIGERTYQLQHHKSNLGPKQAPLDLEWPIDGLPMAAGSGPVVQGYLDDKDTAALLRLIHEFYGRGEWISPATQSRHHAPALLSGQKEYPERRTKEVFDLLRDAERDGLLVREGYKDSNRKHRERWTLTDKGLRTIGAPCASCAPCA